MSLEVMEKLSSHLKTRLVDLRNAKEEGRKVIGYAAGGYFPEELALACGAIPICLIRGGDHSAVELASAYVCRWIDPFWRSQIGYAVSGSDPYYDTVDIYVIPITDNHVRAVSDILDYYTGLEIFPFGVPHMKEKTTRDYYLQGLIRLKAKLEELTGVEITEPRLSEAIDLCNKERALLRNISLLRKYQAPPINSKDFVALNHGSFVADKKVMVEVLSSVYEELKGQPPSTLRGPRMLLTGSTLALGDSKVLDLVEEAGGVIVIEDFAEGMRPYWGSVDLNGDLIESLANCYFMERPAPAWFRPSREGLEFVVKLAKDFTVEGVVWYQLMYRESYKTESYYFPTILKREVSLPMLTVESDYDPLETGPLRTRIETFVETIRR
jgi:benzoyl-CoA reductase/2-hydroxyglutaryl-CoA dehydratase subunit BcrC/BadD/HgdB